ncbi:putative nucleic acid-binding Zn-ribbon protein [Bradyrhizobium sp. USDA 4452]
MQPLLEQSAAIRTEVVDLKEKLKRLKRNGEPESKITAVEARIREQDKAARDLEAEAAGIDAQVFDLKAVNPNAVAKLDDRTPVQIIRNIEAQGRIVAQALTRLSALMAAEELIEDGPQTGSRRLPSAQGRGLGADIYRQPN